MIEDDYSFICPYCSWENGVQLDVTAGAKQSFIQDCVTCCKPMLISLSFQGEELSDFSVEGQD